MTGKTYNNFITLFTWNIGMVKFTFGLTSCVVPTVLCEIV